MSNLRAVNVLKYEYDDKSRKYITVPDGNAVFHMFGREDAGNGEMFTIAIIERHDGQVQTVAPTLIKFVDPMVIEFVETKVDFDGSHSPIGSNFRVTGTELSDDELVNKAQ